MFWRPAPTEVPAAAPVLLVAGRLTVRILQALDAEQSRWPLKHRAIELRYNDAGTVELWVPTRSAFAAMKTLAWADRHAPRDLADLAELARTGSFNVDAARLVHDMSGVWPRPHLFDSLPGATRAVSPISASFRCPRRRSQSRQFRTGRNWRSP